MVNECKTLEDLSKAGLLGSYVWCHYCDSRGWYKIVAGVGIIAQIVLDNSNNSPYQPFKPFNPAVKNDDPNCFFQGSQQKKVRTTSHSDWV